MKDYLNEFNSYLSLIKKSSRNTIDSYKSDVLKFWDFLSDNNIYDTSIASEEIINSYIISFNNAGKSSSTITRIVSSLKCYYKFLQSIGKRDVLPKIRSGISKPTKSLPQFLDTSEVKLLLAQPDDTDPKGIRDKAMLELLYATGIRVSELIEMEISALNLDLEIIKIKSDKSERVIPIYKDAIKTLSLYVKHVRPGIVTDVKQTKLFTNMSGAVLTRQGFWKILKYYADKAGITKDITPHTIRHSFAIHLLENGAELPDIKELLGHSDISTTQVYSQIIKNKYSKSYRNFHPLAGK